MTVPSLRARLTVIILVPLVLISIFAGYWRFTVALQTTEALFDRTLLASSLAIARDVLVSGGDALSETTRDLIRDSSGGQIFYHVHGPDGVFITGYATPPVPPSDVIPIRNKPVFFQSVYRGQDVRVVRLREAGEVDGVSGFSTVTVWQDFASRDQFARALGLRAAVLMASLIVTVAAVVWFGISLGLRPLTDLQAAISRRSTEDLGLIRRPLPREVSGLVATLNSLFKQVSEAMESKDVFISNAAHQLRNPIAGVLSMAEAAHSGKTSEETERRTGELAEAARHLSRLATQLLSYERAQARANAVAAEDVELVALVQSVADRNAPRVLARDLELEFDAADSKTIAVRGDPVLLSEAIENLIDNALCHGGATLSHLCVRVSSDGAKAEVTISDDGRGIKAEDRAKAFDRFSQLQPGSGSGLGLSIVETIAKSHGGRVVINDVDQGTSIAVILPVSRTQR